MDKNRLLKYKVGMNLTGTGNLSKIFACQAFSNNNFPITPEQFSVLAVLYENNNLYQRQISALTLKDRPNISRIVCILDEMGCVTKTPDVSGRKVFKIAITQKGIDLYKQVLPEILRVWLETVEGVEEGDLDIFYNVLSMIRENLISKVNIQI